MANVLRASTAGVSRLLLPPRGPPCTPRLPGSGQSLRTPWAAASARLNGPITARGNVCACPPCTAGNYTACEMKALFGEVRRVKVPREKNQNSGLRQLESLHL